MNGLFLSRVNASLPMLIVMALTAEPKNLERFRVIPVMSFDSPASTTDAADFRFNDIPLTGVVRQKRVCTVFFGILFLPANCSRLRFSHVRWIFPPASHPLVLPLCCLHN